MVRTTLSTRLINIQVRHLGPEHPPLLLPPPNTIMNKPYLHEPCSNCVAT
jgi:hypothetical protein